LDAHPAPGRMDFVFVCLLRAGNSKWRIEPSCGLDRLPTTLSAG